MTDLPLPEPPAPPPLPAPRLVSVPWKSEYCTACPVPHAFWVMDKHGVRITHTVQANGDVVCDLCTIARPCLGTVVRGRSGVRLATYPSPDKARYRGLNRDGPVH